MAQELTTTSDEQFPIERLRNGEREKFTLKAAIELRDQLNDCIDHFSDNGWINSRIENTVFEKMSKENKILVRMVENMAHALETVTGSCPADLWGKYFNCSNRCGVAEVEEQSRNCFVLHFKNEAIKELNNESTERSK